MALTKRRFQKLAGLLKEAPLKEASLQDDLRLHFGDEVEGLEAAIGALSKKLYYSFHDEQLEMLVNQAISNAREALKDVERAMEQRDKLRQRAQKEEETTYLYDQGAFEDAIVNYGVGDDATADQIWDAFVEDELVDLDDETSVMAAEDAIEDWVS